MDLSNVFTATIALLLGVLYGAYLSKSFRPYMRELLICGMFLVRRRRLKAIYEIAEENYDLLTDIFQIDVSHAAYLNAFMTMREDAWSEFKTYMYMTFKLWVSLWRYFFIFLAVLLLVFISQWMLFLVGFLTILLMRPVYDITKFIYHKELDIYMMMVLCRIAYRYTYKKSVLHKQDKSSANGSKV